MSMAVVSINDGVSNFLCAPPVFEHMLKASRLGSDFRSRWYG